MLKLQNYLLKIIGSNKMESKQTLDFKKICQWFENGEKSIDEWRIGTEHEKFLFKKRQV